MDASLDSTTRVYDYRSNLITVNRSFAGMEPLLLRAIRLSLNAEIASAHVGEAGRPFGIVVRELSYMGEKLSELINEVEAEFSKVVHSVAKWVALERRMTLYLKGYLIANEGMEEDDEEKVFKDSGDNLNLYSEETFAKWLHALQRYTVGSAQYHLLENAIECRNEIVTHMKSIMELTDRLSRLLDTINMVAVRQSHFVAVTALVEAAQVSDIKGQIKTIAQEIQILSREIHGVESSAKDKIIAVASRASLIFSHI